MRENILTMAMLVTLLSACGGGEPPTCTGSDCGCVAGMTCSIDEGNCGPTSCSLSCETGSVCEGSCGESCSVSCATDSTCDLTVGASSSVSCSSGGECHVTCRSSCSVSCGSGSTCSIQCAGMSSRPIDGSAECPAT